MASEAGADAVAAVVTAATGVRAEAAAAGVDSKDATASLVGCP